jgi:predicted permease
MQTLWHDLRYGWRLLVRNPAFTLTAVLSLALGIGATTAIFSVVNALLFKPLPYPEPERLAALASHQTQRLEDDFFWSYPALTIFRTQSRTFETAAYTELTATVTVGEQPEVERGEIVSAEYFSILGLSTKLGRTILPEEDRVPSAHPLIVLGDELWQRRFGGDRGVIGKTIYLNQLPFTVVGVLTPGFRGQSGAAEFWAPLMMAGKLKWEDIFDQPGTTWLKIIARLKPGVSFVQARAEAPLLAEAIARIALRSRRANPGTGELKVIPYKETKVDPAVARAFLILFAAVGCVLLIACANTANLLLSRSIARRKEFAVRLSLGADRWRVLRQVLTESLLLTILGGAVGLIIALWGVDWLTTAKPWNSSGVLVRYAATFDYFTIRLDGRVLAFNFLLALVTGVLSGIFPAWQASRLQLTEMLKAGSGSSISGLRPLRRPSLRGALVIAELAFSLVLLAGAGLTIKSFARLTAVNLGFAPQGVVTMDVGASEGNPDFSRLLLERIRAMPGVEAASLSGGTPLVGALNSSDIEIGGGASGETAKARAGINVVTPDYFKTYRIAVQKGRGLLDRDRAGSPRVAVINRILAERVWPGEEPLGKRFRIPFRARYQNAEDWIEVVGVADNVKYGAVDAPTDPIYYLSAYQPTLSISSLSIRSQVDAASMAKAVRREIQTLDKSVPIYRLTTMQDRVEKASGRYRYSALLMSLFAALALILAGAGIYSVMAYAVSARTPELGVRLALGAAPAQIIKLVLADGAVLSAIGLAVGLTAAFAATRILQSQLYEVRTGDPLVFLVTALVLIVIALAACYLPARRAARVDPLIALREY